MREISDLKAQLQRAEARHQSTTEKASTNVNVVTVNNFEEREEAYRKTIAEADAILAKVEQDYQQTIK